MATKKKAPTKDKVTKSSKKPAAKKKASTKKKVPAKKEPEVHAEKKSAKKSVPTGKADRVIVAILEEGTKSAVAWLFGLRK